MLRPADGSCIPLIFPLHFHGSNEDMSQQKLRRVQLLPLPPQLIEVINASCLKSSRGGGCQTEKKSRSDSSGCLASTLSRLSLPRLFSKLSCRGKAYRSCIPSDGLLSRGGGGGGGGGFGLPTMFRCQGTAEVFRLQGATNGYKLSPHVSASPMVFYKYM